MKRLLYVAMFGLALVLPRQALLHAQDVPAATQATRESAPAEQSAEKKQEEQIEGYRHSKTVQTLGRMAGLNAEQAASAFTLLNLAVLVGLVCWFLVRALPKTFRDRNSLIQKHLVDARAATEEATARLNSVEERLGRLDGQISSMRTQAERDAVLDEKRIKASVEDEKAKILAAAEQEIAAATTHAQRQIQQYAAELAIEQATRKLAISAETDRLLVQNFARRLGMDESKEGQN